MSIDLPTPRNFIIPQVPNDLARNNPELFNYLKRLTTALGQMQQGLFDNDSVMAAAMNSGTSGTFTVSSGGSIVVTSGVVITVTS